MFANITGYDDFTGEYEYNGQWYDDLYEVEEAYLDECDRAYEEYRDRLLENE